MCNVWNLQLAALERRKNRSLFLHTLSKYFDMNFEAHLLLLLLLLPLPFFQNHYLYIYFAPSVSDFFCSLLPLFFNHPFTNSRSLFCYVHLSHSVSKQNFLVYRKILRIVVRSEIIKIPSHRIHTHLLSLNTWLSSQVADSKLEEWKITTAKIK